MAQGAISPELRAKLARRFEDKPGFQAWLARNGVPAPTAEAPVPWDIIHAALVRGQAGGLNTRQLAGGIYAALVSHGMMDGKHA